MRVLAACLLSGLVSSWAVAGDALALHPRNPRYFVYHGRPTALVGSGEHYGAVLNPDFDYRAYLAALAADEADAWAEIKDSGHGWDISNSNIITNNAFETCDAKMGSTNLRVCLCNISPCDEEWEVADE